MFAEGFLLRPLRNLCVLAVTKVLVVSLLFINAFGLCETYVPRWCKEFNHKAHEGDTKPQKDYYLKSWFIGMDALFFLPQDTEKDAMFAERFLLRPLRNLCVIAVTKNLWVGFQFSNASSLCETYVCSYVPMW